MKVLKHIIEQPFIFATGLAALAHSTWSLGTLFAGNEPTQFTMAWLAWLIPAFLIAFSLDIGQISTSARIRSGQKKAGNYVTFGVLAFATYYLQFLYIAHHMPMLTLSSGIGAEHLDKVLWLRNWGIWIVPALLPVSTLLYTFSGQDNHVVHAESETAAEPNKVELQLAVVEQPSSEVVRVETVDSSVSETCEFCGQVFTKATRPDVNRALKLHQTRHCAQSKLVANQLQTNFAEMR